VVSANTQSRRLFLALVLLLIALAGVVLNDRQFWFGSAPAGLNDSSATLATPAVMAPAVATKRAAAPVTGRPVSAPPTPTKSAVVNRNRSTAPASSEPQPVDAAPAVTRTVLPPLEVEVVAGDKHSTIRPGSNATKVEITRPGSEPLAAATKAAEREHLSADVSQTGSQTSYPLLAQHMNVQGSVVLQALIGADGVIQHIKVVNGPAILTSAAEQAVREWRFKPVLQNGQAVETQARITVNFNIKVADGSAKTTVAENEPGRIQVLSR
jgi:protein TonB